MKAHETVRWHGLQIARLWSFSIPILTKVFRRMRAFGIFFWESHHGATVAQARTATVNVIIFVGIFYLFNCRSLVHPIFRSVSSQTAGCLLVSPR